MPNPPHHSADTGEEPGTPDWPSGLEALVESELPDFLQRQRWYPAKDSGMPHVALSALLPFRACSVASAVAVWQVTPPGRPPLHLFVPLALVPGDKADPAQIIANPQLGSSGKLRLVEAFSVDAFVRAWIDLLLLRGSAASGPVQLQTGRTDRLARAGLEAGRSWTIRRGSAEQSNTSIRVGDGAILKVIRKLESGVHPELEVGRFLTEKTGFTSTPSLLG